MVNIYKITNQIDGKIYIGQTVQKVWSRWNSHRNMAKRGKDLFFYRAIRKHGEENFIVEHIGAAENKTWADYLERVYIRIHNTTNQDFGYNMTYGGQGGLHIPENKIKIGEKSKEWWAVPENRKRASESRKGLLVGERNPMFGTHPEGKPHTEETIQLLSDKAKERYQDPEYKARMVEANTDKHHTEEGKANITAALQGNTYRLGTTQSEETKAKIAAGLKKAFAEGRRKKTGGIKKGAKLGPMSDEMKAKIAEGVKKARQENPWSTKSKLSQPISEAA